MYVVLCLLPLKLASEQINCVENKLVCYKPENKDYYFGNSHVMGCT
jgi:hypothetical protein